QLLRRLLRHLCSVCRCCLLSVLQVSRPLPPRMDGGQTPWLLSLRGELVASLEDASLMGLDVDIGASTVTIQSPRQELLQRQEVWNTSLELLPLWLVSGSYAYSLKAACPLASSQPGAEISVHIPKQRLGLVRRGSRVEESLSPRFLRVHQSDTFTVTEDRDFLVVSIPAPLLLQDQPCPEARDSPGTQAFYRIDLSLAFAEMVSPVHWTVENFFQCVGSREESLVSTATPGTALPTLSPGWETAAAEAPSAASPQFQISRMAALDEPLWRFLDQGVPFTQTTRPEGGGWVSTASPFPATVQEHHGLQTPPKKADLIPHPQTPATLSLEHTEASQAAPRPSQWVFLSRTSMTTHSPSEVPSPLWPSWRSDGPQMLLGSEPSVPLTEVPRAMMAGQDPTQPSGSPFPLGKLSRETVKSTESVDPTRREPAHISEEFPPLTRPFVSSLAEEGLIFHHASRRPQELLPTIKAEGPLQNDRDPSGEGARGYLDPSTSEPSQGMEGMGLIILSGTDVTFTSPRGRQPDASDHLVTPSPELSGRHRVGPAVPQTTLARDLLASTSEKPATPSEGGTDRTLQLESAPIWPEGWHEPWAGHTTSPLPQHTQSLLAPTETILPHSSEPWTPLSNGQESMEARLAPTPDSHQLPEL
uniref:Predicted gene 572 n=1 Tax=Peromyscus maniculatus bairdii TaxID=230844 RepID=A0A8C8TLV3_PERMB